MNIKNFFNSRNSEDLVSDQLLYDIVGNELSRGDLNQGLWTKALTDCEWNESKAKARYVKMRISQLRRGSVPSGVSDKNLPRNSAMEAAEFGLSSEEIDYLGKPIKAIRYLEKYGVSEKKVSSAISLGKLRSVICNGVLWVRDVEIN